MLIVLAALVLAVLASLLLTTWHLVHVDRPRATPPTSRPVDPDLLPPSMRLFPH